MIYEFASKHDVENWMILLETVKDSFPGLNMTEYKNALLKRIENKEAIVAKNGEIIVGAMIFSKKEKELCFLAVHPQYRKLGIAKNIITKMISLFPKGTTIFVITYREEDLQGIAARKLYKGLGFQCGELVTVFDYPCQRLTYNIN